MADAACVMPPLHTRLFNEALMFMVRADVTEVCVAAMLAPLLLACLGRLGQRMHWHLYSGDAATSGCGCGLPQSGSSVPIQTADAAKKCSSSCAPKPQPCCTPGRKILGGILGGLEHLPAELRAEVGACLSLSDLAALSVSEVAQQHGIWSTPEVWARLAHRHGCGGAATALLPFGCGAAPPSIMRERFRKAAFRVDGGGLLALFTDTPPQLGDFAPLFAEASHLLRGLMPQDGPTPSGWLCEILASALRSYDASEDRLVDAASSVLRAARLRGDILSEEQIQSLSAANSHAVTLGRILDSAMQEHEQQLQAQRDEMLSSVLHEVLLDTGGA